jgi:hypothetical protein
MFGVRPASRERDYPLPHASASRPFVGRWGILGYYVPAGLMHSDDVERYLAEPKGGEDLYCCVEEEGPFVRVRNNAGREFRVNPDRFIWIATPRFQLGDEVATQVGTSRLGWVSVRGWHYQERRVYYLIDIPAGQGRKRHSRRYWDDELELQPAAEAAQGKLTRP